MSERQGLRVQKKLRTRKEISRAAADLFLARGFDAVTVAEVAEEAAVSTKTVFNYFPRKEDLFFDRLSEAIDQITRTVRERPAGSDALPALRRAFGDLPRSGHPLSSLGDRYPRFWELVLNSPALQARAREIGEELEIAIAGLLAETRGAPPGDPRLQLVASFVVAAYRTAYRAAASKILADEDPDDAAAAYTAQIERAFDAIERAVMPW